MNCQTFSTGFSSGERGGSGRSVMLSGMTRRVETCQPAWSRISTACAPGSMAGPISARWACIASVSANGMTSAAPLPSFRADRAEDVGPLRALVVRGTRAGAAARPAPRHQVFLADAGFVLKPDLDALPLGMALTDLRHDRTEVLWSGPPLPAARLTSSPHAMKKERAMTIAILGIDLGKNICSVVGLDGAGEGAPAGPA